MTEPELLKLVARAYDAALDPAGWTGFLEAYAQLVDGAGVGLVRLPATAGQEIQTVTVGYDPAYLETWHAHYHDLDPGRELSRQAPVGKVGFDPVPLAERTLTEFYADWLEPQGLGGSASYGVNVDIGEFGTTVLGVYPARGGHAPGTTEGELTEALAPHLRRALHASDLWRRADHERNALGDTLDLLPTGILLVDAQHRVRRINRAAGTILRLADGLAVERGELRASTPTFTALLHRQIDRARRTAAGELADATGALMLGRPSGRRAFEVFVAPLGERAAFSLEPDVVAVVFVRDPAAVPLFDARTLRELFGFTPAETRLAQRLGAGSTLAEAAAELGISLGTARNRLKSLFKKTGTHRQADLVRRLTLGPAGLGSAGPERTD